MRGLPPPVVARKQVLPCNDGRGKPRTLLRDAYNHKLCQALAAIINSAEAVVEREPEVATKLVEAVGFL
ncbi:hypothetical protein GCM10022408_29620 [Hymenobacter fastidiosus]|uniref:Uncharacterized protein n=1 Tax=Hymenobacter fastidiosus TaxID=486264 RepID=A0ABP7SP28_9BACT